MSNIIFFKFSVKSLTTQNSSRCTGTALIRLQSDVQLKCDAIRDKPRPTGLYSILVDVIQLRAVCAIAKFSFC